MGSSIARKAAVSVTTVALVAGSVVSAQAATGVHTAAVHNFVVTNTSDAGLGSLRAAITSANAIGASDSARIVFATPVPSTITLVTALPQITKPTTLDAGTAIPTSGAPQPEVTIDFADSTGLAFGNGSKNSKLLGFSLINAFGPGVLVADDNILINNNLIGLTRTGARGGSDGAGIQLSPAASGTTIGLNTARKSGVIGNVISDNGGDGINLDGSSDTTIQANRIGTNLAGSAAIPNNGSGIQLHNGAHDNMIGGSAFRDSGTGKINNPTGSEGSVTPVFIVPPLGNQISGNDTFGVNINSGSVDNVLSGNFIGTRADGNAAVGNGLDGVVIVDSDRNALIGCQFRNNPFVYYNVLSGNGGNGLIIHNSDKVVVQANFFGTGANNTTRVKNRLNGILVSGDSRDVQVGGIIPLGNVSAGNGLSGIDVRGTVSNFETFNTFGGLLAFKGAMPNGTNGLTVTSTGSGNLARTNVWSGNTGNGVEISGDATGFTLDPNIVGLTTNGKTPLPNGKNGLLIAGNAHHNIISSNNSSVIPQNLFSGNKKYGMAFLGASHHNTVVDAFIGTTVFGTSAAGNGSGGLVIGPKSHHNIIGRFAGRSLNTRGDLRPLIYSNIISGNFGPGISILQGSVGNIIRNNLVGVGRFGFALPNAGGQIINNGRGTILIKNTTAPVR